MSLIKSAVGVLLITALDVACQGTLPPSEAPHGSPEGAPSMRAADTATAGPLADEGLASPPDTLPGPGAPITAAEPAAGGTNALPLPAPRGGTGAGGAAGGAVR
jgi:hypothetical protein